ncbi:MAG: T9SS type A sorting domain-containing protein [Flavobacteriales bacterium]|nr:MAG: T9SS type A sorting domain-containing protein [Flavobacteriales bacterium]
MSARRILCLGLLVLAVFSLSGQDTRWMRLYDHQSTVNTIGSVGVVPDTGYYIGIASILNGAGELTPFSIDAEGDTLWTKRYPEPFHTLKAGSINIRPDGSWLWAGTALPTDTQEWRGIVYCFEADGDTLWRRVYGTDELDGFNASTLTSSGNLLTVGSRLSTTLRIWAAEIDEWGDTLWTRTYPSAYWENAVSVTSSLDGGFAIGAYREVTSTNDDMLVLKISANGALEWRKAYGGSWNDNYGFVTDLVDGGYIMCGGQRTGQTSGLFPTIYRLQDNGDTLWSKIYTEHGRGVFFSKPIEMADGGFALSGGGEGDQSSSIGFLSRTDSSGVLLWHRTYSTNPNIDQYIYDLRRTLDGGFIMAGTAFDTAPPLSQDAWLIKTDSFGCIVPGCQVFDAVLEQYTSLQGALQVSPNPTTDVVQVSITLPPGLVAGNDAKLTLVDAQGRKVMEQALPSLVPSQVTTVSLSHLPSALYFLHLTDGKRWLAGARVVRQ